jgi:hypothetical protein
MSLGLEMRCRVLRVASFVVCCVLWDSGKDSGQKLMDLFRDR